MIKRFKTKEGKLYLKFCQRNTKSINLEIIVTISF